jgi:hypothetical protein
MKKYSNTAQEMRFVHFEDGTAQFLFRGQSFVSDKPTTVVQKGIRVSDVQKVAPTGQVKQPTKPKVSPTTTEVTITKE